MLVRLWILAILWIAGFVVVFLKPGFVLYLVGVEKPSPRPRMFVRRLAIAALIAAMGFIGALLRHSN